MLLLPQPSSGFCIDFSISLSPILSETNVSVAAGHVCFFGMKKLDELHYHSKLDYIHTHVPPETRRESAENPPRNPFNGLGGFRRYICECGWARIISISINGGGQ